MSIPEEKDYENSPYLIMIKPNVWLNSNEYRNCELYKINDEEFNFYYGALNQYSAWVKIKRENNIWVYYRLGNKSFKSKPYILFGDLLDDAVEDMIRAKLYLFKIFFFY